MTRRQDRGRHDRKRRGGRYREGGKPKGRSRREPRPVPKRELVSRGKALDVGLDGMLRVELDPLDLKAAGTLTSKGGGQVVTNRGEGLGRVVSVVGTLEHPIAIVKVYPDARRLVRKLMGKEVFLG
jgi:hypothetical protein